MVAGVRAGVDVGATLAKLAVAGDGLTPAYHLFPSAALQEVARQLEVRGAVRVGLTGGGAPALERLLSSRAFRVDEFRAWGLGAGHLLGPEAPAEPYLLVSLGTGTSVMRVEGEAVVRVGGTALGGGTAAGLGAALLGETDFSRLCQLASRGCRSRVDLLVSDIYRPGEIALPGEWTAASFGKLARPRGESPRPEDLAAAVMGLVGENVALICGGLAIQAGVRRVVFAGATLRGNPFLARTLTAVCAMIGCQARVLRNGEFAGAVGALRLGGGG